MYGGPQQPSFINTIQALTGINWNKDLNGGMPNCVSVTPIVSISLCLVYSLSTVSQLCSLFKTINWHDQGRRASAPEAYYTPVENARPNWVILTKHQVRLVLSSVSLSSVANQLIGHQN